MKKLLSKFFVIASLLIISGTLSANADEVSEYTFTPSQWSGTIGTVDNTSAVIKATAYQYSCAEVKTTTSFKIPKRQTYLVVRGTNLVSGTNNPCLYNFNGSDISSKPKFTNSGDSVLYLDITSYMSSLPTDFLGRCTISSLGIYIQEPTPSSESDITSISFEPVDWLAVSTPVITQNGTACTPTSAAGNTITTKTWTFTPNTAAKEFNIKLTPSSTMSFNSSDAYIVIESSANITNGVRKLANLTIGGTKYGYTGGNNNSKNLTLKNGHYLQIMSSLSNIPTLLSLYQSQTDIASTYMEMYLYTSDLNPASIYRIGLYNFEEICKMYPELKTYDWQFFNSNSMSIETYGTAGTTFRLKEQDGSNTTTIAQAVSMIRSLGALPSNYTTLTWHNMKFASGLTPLTYDLYKYMTSTPAILLDKTAFNYFPTTNPNIKVQGSYYYAYKDGTAPSSVTKTSDGAHTTTYSSFTRELKAGYNSCILPFDISTSNLPSGLSAYTYTSDDAANSKVWFTLASGTIAAETPFIIKATTAGLYCIAENVAPTTTTLSNYYTSGKFVGSFVKEQPMATGKDYAEKYCLGLQTDGSAFAPMTASNYTTYYRAFLAYDSNPFQSGAKSIELGISDDTPTGISEVTTSSDKVNVYNISGMMIKRNVNLNSSLEGLSNRIYIIKGKKVIK